MPWQDHYGPGKLILELYEKTAEGAQWNPVFATEYPIEVSPLARPHRELPGMTERFEAIVAGRELCNAFSELLDPDVQRERFEDQVRQGQAGDDGRRELVVEKLNYGKPGLTVPLRYDAERHVFARDGEVADTGTVASIRDRNERRTILRALLEVETAGRSVSTAPRANMNAAAILSPLPGFPPALRTQAGRKRLFGHLLQAEADGLIERDVHRTPARHVVERWRVTEAGRTESGQEGA